MATLHRIYPAEAATEIGAEDKYSAESGRVAVVLLLCSASIVFVILFAVLSAL